MPSSSASAQTITEPLFFTCKGRPLYGLYCAPAATPRGGLAMVACHSVGVEQAVPSNMLARMVRAAAGAGFAAMLFHARGHGDSTGDFADVCFESLTEDAAAAADYVRRRSGAAKVVWLGVRFGGLVAASCANTRDDTAGVALWEPVHRGMDYFRQLLRGLLFAASARGGRTGLTVDELLARVERDGRVDVNATYLHAKLLRSARELQLADLLDGLRTPTLLAQVQPRLSFSPDNSALISKLTAAGISVHTSHIKDEPGWQFWRPSWCSPALLEATGEWLNGLA